MANKTYFFQPEKKIMKQGFFLTDENNRIVYETKVLKQSLFGASDVEFVNHITGKSGIHKIGKTVTTETSGPLGFFSTKSYFKYDGKKIWDYLHETGIRIESSISGSKIGMVYKVYCKGEEIAVIATAAPNGSKFIVTGSFTFDITTSEEYLDQAFLAAYAFARTDQAFYN